MVLRSFRPEMRIKLIRPRHQGFLLVSVLATAAAASKFSTPQASARCVEGQARFALGVEGGGTGLNLGLSAWCSRFGIAGSRIPEFTFEGFLGGSRVHLGSACCWWQRAGRANRCHLPRQEPPCCTRPALEIAIPTDYDVLPDCSI